MSVDYRSGIYAIENVYDFRAYIGAAKWTGFDSRWCTHRVSLRHGKHYNKALQRDWNLLGSGWFKFVPLEILSMLVAFVPREQYWIDEILRRGYHCYNLARPIEAGF
jgi:hypothetical protein